MWGNLERVMQAASATTEPVVDHAYHAFLETIRAKWAGVSGPLFTTDAIGLFDTFLAALPEEDRQHHTCHACRRFVDTFGGLVTIDEAGTKTPAMWEASKTPGIWQPGIAALYNAVMAAKVVGVHVSSEKVYGLPVTGAWRHMAVTPPKAMIWKMATKTASQEAAEKLEDYGILNRGLSEFPAEAVAAAKTYLINGTLYRSEKCIGVATWLDALHVQIAGMKDARRRSHIVWRAVAMAPPGFCHVRSTMIGTLLEDIVAGLPFAEIKARFDSKMNPLQYQRPTAPPSDGNIAQAEAIVGALRAAGALGRRFARLEDIRALWTPAPVTPSAPEGGVFGHLKGKAAAKVEAPTAATVTMTWEKFARTVIPDAVSMECLVPTVGSFYAFVTAANPDAAPLLQWDRDDARNTVSWYTYAGGSSASHWRVVAGAWCPVTALSLFPQMWGGTHDHQGDGVLVVLSGAQDSRYERGAGFFPEQLRSEFHAVRRTMEAYAQNATISGRDEASACGLGLRKGQTANTTIRVHARSGPPVVYLLDRWD